MRHPDVSLAILTGGKGTRLGGVAKGELVFQGRPLLEWVLDFSSGFAETLLVTSSSHPVRRPSPGAWHRTVVDVLPGRGAPGGVHAALQAAHTPWVLVTAWDMPGIQKVVLDRLLGERSRAPGAEILCFEVAGRLEPLLGLYRAALARRWAEALGEGASFRALYPHFEARVLPEAELRAVDPEARSVASVNTPEDFARLEAEWRRS